VNLRIGFSPCPNDTYIFDAMVHGKIDTGDLHFEPVLEDVETLNGWALEGKLDITKLSFPAFFASTHQYTLLDAGSALGKGVGPLLVSASGKDYSITEIGKASIAIPGVHTTANLLLGFAYPGAGNKRPMIFSSIEDAVVNGETELGVIIHESRFTFREKGLHQVADLGGIWEAKMKMPIPLGGIAIKTEISESVRKKVDSLVRQSVEYAFSKDPYISDYVRAHAQTMSEEVMRMHIGLYVNDYTRSLGKEGRRAIEKLYDVYREMAGHGR
jgi:1,4-dihydroxy-6-naphthoate synthase